MKFELAITSKYTQDVKRAKKRGLPMDKLNEVIRLLAEGEPLPAKYKDHALVGNYAGCRDCHISPDWILIYEKDTQIRLITLQRTGTHSDLFK